jgi:hypothetical protein
MYECCRCVSGVTQLEDVTYSGSVVQVEMSLLERLAVITLGVRQTEESLLQEVAGKISKTESSSRR